MIIDVRKYMPAMRRTCAEMVLKNGLKQLERTRESSYDHQRYLSEDTLIAEMQHAVEILRKESTTRIGPVTKRNHKQKNK